MSKNVKIFVSVPQDCMGLVIGTGGKNINEIKRETGTRIKPCDGDGSGKESGFEVTGKPVGCEKARQAIQHRIDNAQAKIMEPVPQQFVRFLIKKNGADNFRVIENECGVKISWPKISGTEKNVIFTISKGLKSNRQRAQEMLRANLEKWEDASKSQTPSKIDGEVRKIHMYVEDKYMPLVVGRNRKSIESVATKSRTKIKVSPRPCAEDISHCEQKGKLEITGSLNDCLRAQSLIKNNIVAFNDRMKRKEYGGDTHFVCFAYKGDNKDFRLEPGKSAPKLDAFIQGQRHRIESELDDDEDQSEINEKTMSEIKDHLLTPLKNLEKIKDEKELIADLWCQFGKVLVFGVDEETVKDAVTPEDIKERLITITGNKEITNKDACWKASFETGIAPSDINDEALISNCEGESRGDFGLKLIHSQWRYDFGFTTPSYRNVRLKAWEGLPPGSDEPPVEVKNILNPVSFDAEEGIKAWICYPSTSILKGEIMIPNSKYDCRMKLRAGPRRVTDIESIGKEEDAALSKYLSKCQFKREEYRMHLPDENDCKIPDDFECGFYREAYEKIFEATVDEEGYTVIVWDEKGWDSDSSHKRHMKQFGVKVVMNSWSDAMLSPERQWTTEEVLEKLEKYMEFLFLLKDYIFYY